MGFLKPMLAAVLLSLHLPAAAAGEFSISFEWGYLQRCNDGIPNRVKNPRFVLTNVPAGTESIEFEMVDLDNSDYYHGGGTVVYSGHDVVAPGAFTYNSPCPRRGSHTFQWTAVARSAGSSSKLLGNARASRSYPE